MKKIVILFFILLGLSVYSQTDSVVRPATLDRKNFLHVSLDFVLLSANYERKFPMDDHFGFALRGGAGYALLWGDIALIGEGMMYAGKNRSFGELGVGYDQPLLGEIDRFLVTKIGYRFEGYNGFLFKLYPMFLVDLETKDDAWGNFVWVGMSLGGSF